MWTMVMIGAAVINPLMNLVLIPLTQHRYHNGGIGAAISLVLTEMAINGAGLVLVGRHVFERRMLKRCALVFPASAAMAVVAEVGRPLGTAVSLTAGLTTLVVLVVVMRVVRTEEVAVARAGLARARAIIVGNRRRKD